MRQILENFLARRPAAGYLGAVPPAVSGLVSWSQIDRILGTLGLAVGLAVGVVTFLAQLENWKKNRRGRRPEDSWKR